MEMVVKLLINILPNACIVTGQKRYLWKQLVIWALLKATMQEYYRRTENLTLRHFQFCSLIQGKDNSSLQPDRKRS